LLSASTLCKQKSLGTAQLFFKIVSLRPGLREPRNKPDADANIVTGFAGAISQQSLGREKLVLQPNREIANRRYLSLHQPTSLYLLIY
jgi:hypothetical protein